MKDCVHELEVERKTLAKAVLKAIEMEPSNDLTILYEMIGMKNPTADKVKMNWKTVVKETVE